MPDSRSNVLIAADWLVFVARPGRVVMLLSALYGIALTGGWVLRGTPTGHMIQAGFDHGTWWPAVVIATALSLIARRHQARALAALENGWLGSAPLAESQFLAAARMRTLATLAALAFAIALALVAMGVGTRAVLISSATSAAGSGIGLLPWPLAGRGRSSEPPPVAVGGTGLIVLGRWPNAILAAWLAPARLAPAMAIPLMLVPAGSSALSAAGVMGLFTFPAIAVLNVLAARLATGQALELLAATPNGPRLCRQRISARGILIALASAAGFWTALILLGLGVPSSTLLAGISATAGAGAVWLAARTAPLQ